MKRFRYIALLVLLLSPLAAWAGEATMLDSLQLRFHTFASWCSPEKVYLHYDRSCFTAGETIWFKGWVRDASRHSVYPPSNFLYAEVLDEKGEAVVRVKIKRTEGGFPGCIELPDNLETGDYTIRAYTLWQLNGDSAYLFNDRLRIVGAKGKKEKRSEVPPPDVDISFWPEGGRYYTGHKSMIGFKVVDRLGKSVDFTGHLVSSRDGAMKPVITGHDGMGAFDFTPQPGLSYSVQDASGKLHPLPAPSEGGATLHLRAHADQYYISVLGFGGEEASLLVRDASSLRPLASVTLDGRWGALVVEKSFFHPGINHLLVVDAQGRILSERLFFVRDETAPLCRLEMKRFVADPRALVRGVISLSNPDGTPLDGNCSVSVTRGVLKDWQQSDGITSYMGLSSELKGRINDPYYYFDPDVPEQERNAALDILMMIQGWRYYDMDKIMDLKGGNFRISHVREMVQEIRGTITRRLSSKMPRKFVFTLMIPKKKLIYSMNVEQGRDFLIDSLDFQENTEFLINIGTSRLGAIYLPKWDGDPAAEPYRYERAPGFAKDARINVPLFKELAWEDTLQAAVVTASYDDDDVLIFGNSHRYREDLVEFKDMTLVEYLSMKQAVFEYDGENMYNRHQRRYSASGSMSGGTPGSDEFDDDIDVDDAAGKVKLIVEDMEEEWWGFDMLRLGDIRSLSISTRPDPIYGGDGGVVHISLKPGGVRKTAERNPSLLYFVPLGHQVPRYFSSPRYDRGETGSNDMRNTVWWSPSVTLSGGRATIEFCNSDLTDFPYVVRIEGLSADGRPFSRHCLLTP